MMTTFRNTAWWWRLVGLRVGKTALVTLSSYIVVGGGFTDVEWAVALSGMALASILSFLTAIFTLPETGAEQPKWLAVLSRTGKTFAQNMIAGIGPAVLVSDVDWATILNISALAAVGTLVLAVVTALPETDAQTVVVPDPEFEEPDDEEIELLGSEEEAWSEEQNDSDAVG